MARAAAAHGAGRRRDAQPGPHARQPAGAPGDLGGRRSPTRGSRCSATPGGAPSAADPAALLDVRRRLEDFTEELRSTERSPEWPIYGALIINLRNIVDAMDVVAEANPIGGNRLPLRIRRRGAA